MKNSGYLDVPTLPTEAFARGDIMEENETSTQEEVQEAVQTLEEISERQKRLTDLHKAQEESRINGLRASVKWRDTYNVALSALLQGSLAHGDPVNLPEIHQLAAFCADLSVGIDRAQRTEL